MARTLTFLHGGTELTTELNRVDRKKVYGWVDKVALDREGRECYLGSLSGDGMHVFGRGSFEQGYLTNDGRWFSSSDLMAVDEDLNEIPKMPSSLKSPIALKETVPVDEYLEHVMKSVYDLGDDAALLELIRSTDEIWMFEFNYNSSHSPDPAFLVENEGTAFMVVGEHAGFDFIGRDEASSSVLGDDDDDEDEDDADPMDFSMMF